MPTSKDGPSRRHDFRLAAELMERLAHLTTKMARPPDEIRQPPQL